MRFRTSFVSDAGNRSTTEDACLLNEKLGLFAVCDGSRASQQVLPAEEICREIESKLGDNRALLDRYAASRSKELRLEIIGVLSEAIQAVNARLYSATLANPLRSGIHASLDVLLVLEDSVISAHTGDTRTYLYQDNDLYRFTKDQTYLNDWLDKRIFSPEEAARIPGASRLKHALGRDPRAAVDFRQYYFRGGDRFVLCTDGFSRGCDDQALLGLLRGIADEIPARALLYAVQAAPGRENTTVVTVDLEATGPTAQQVRGLFQKFEIIRKSVLFSSLDTQEALKLLSLGQLQQLKPGELLLREGQPGSDLYFILDGEVTIESRGTRRGTCRGGELIGEIAAFDGSTRTADAIARVPTLVMRIDGSELSNLIDRNWELGNKILRSVIREMGGRFRARELHG